MSGDAARARTDTEAGTDVSGLRVPFAAGGEPYAVRVRGRLVKLIAAKLALDLLFVCGLALYTHAVTFARGFDGELERASGLEVSGWVVDLEQPGAAVEVQLFLNGHFAAAAVATGSVAVGTPSNSPDRGRRTFVFQFERPRYGQFEARVYAVREGRGGTRRTLQQIGVARGFQSK
jgi:hypothetical protein